MNQNVFHVLDEKNISSSFLNNLAFKLGCSKTWPFNSSLDKAFQSGGQANKELMQTKKTIMGTVL